MTGCAAGAVCLYDERRELLRLAAESGLSDEGCRRLRMVRRGDLASWDMPLQGLLNRRAYLIESASQNRYVPPLVDTPPAVRTIACLPVYRGNTALASLVLVTRIPRAFTERDVRGLEQPLRELASLIEAVRRHASERPSATAAAEPPRAPTPLPASPRAEIDPAAVTAERERVRLADALEQLQSDAARDAARVVEQAAEIDRLRAQLAQAEAGAAHEQRTREQLEAALERGASSGQHETQKAEEAVKRAETTLAAVVAENARLASELERRRGTEQEATAAHTAEIEHLQARLKTAEAAAARERHAREELATLTEEAASRRVAELDRALEAADAERDATTADLARARVELDAAAAETTRLCAALDAATADAREARASLVTSTDEATRVRTALDAGNAETSRLRTALDASAADATRLRAELDEAAAETARTRAALEATEENAGEARLALEAVTTAEGATRAALEVATRETAEARAALEALTSEAARTRADLEAANARLDAAGGENQRLAGELEAAQAERERFERLLDEAAAREATLADDLARTRTEQADAATAATSRLDMLTAECERLRARVEELQSEAPAPVAVAAPPVKVVGTTTAPVAPPPPVRPAAVQPGLSIVAVIDATQAWESAGTEEHRVVVISPDDDVAARLAELAPKRVVVNLASARALDAAMALRAAGVVARLWGCLADPARGRVLPIGMVEVASRPLDPDAVVAALGAYTTRGGRVMTIGDDVDAFVSLRQALARQGLSVSMAWNAKQADELLPMVKPAAVVVDLALPPRDGAGIVAQLGACDPVPATLLIPSGRDQALAFLAALNDASHAERVLPLERLIARVLAKSETSPKGEAGPKGDAGTVR